MNQINHPRMPALSMEELIEANGRLRSLIYTLDSLSHAHEVHSTCDSFSVTSLGRRIAPSSIPPTFLRFNSESGPLEPLPNLFQVPFPTLETLKGSLLNSKISASKLITKAPLSTTTHRTQQTVQRVDTTPNLPEPQSRDFQHNKSETEDEEYADDF